MATKRKGTNGAAKGAAFERLMSRELSLWISAGKSDELLWRTGGSGARSTNRFKQGRGYLEHQTSDVGMAHPDAKPFTDRFVVECKFYKTIDLHRMFLEARSSVVGAWWKKVCGEAEAVGREPLLIVKGNALQPLIFARAGRMQGSRLSEEVRQGRVIVGALDAGCVELSVLIKTTTFEQFADQDPDYPSTFTRKGRQRARLLFPLPDTADD